MQQPCSRFHITTIAFFLPSGVLTWAFLPPHVISSALLSLQPGGWLLDDCNHQRVKTQLTGQLHIWNSFFPIITFTARRFNVVFWTVWLVLMTAINSLLLAIGCQRMICLAVFNPRRCGQELEVQHMQKLPFSLYFLSERQPVRSHPTWCCPDASVSGNVACFRVCNLQKSQGWPTSWIAKTLLVLSYIYSPAQQMEGGGLQSSF